MLFEVINLNTASYEELSKLFSLVRKNFKEIKSKTDLFSNKKISELTEEELRLYERYRSLNQLMLSVLDRLNPMIDAVDLKEVLNG